MSPQWQTSTPMTFFNITVSPYFQDFSVFSSFTNYSLTYDIPYIQFTSQLCSGLLSVFSYIPHPMKAGTFIYFVDELMHSQQWCARACLDHILGANGCKSVLTSELSKGTLIAWNLPWWETSPLFVYPTSDSFYIFFLNFFTNNTCCNQLLRFCWLTGIDSAHKLFKYVYLFYIYWISTAWLTDVLNEKDYWFLVNV